MNQFTVSSVLLLSAIAVFGISAQSKNFTFKNVGDAGDKQVATVEFDLNGTVFTDEKYRNLHREILNALNRRSETTTIEPQTTQHTTTEPTTKTTVTTAAATTVEETTLPATETTTVTTPATTVEETTLEATEPTTVTTAATTIEETTLPAETTTTAEPETTTTIVLPPTPARRRRSLSEEFVYENEDVFFFDDVNDGIKNGVIRVPVGLHKEGHNISSDRLYYVLIDMNKTRELGSSVSLLVVAIYRGFPKNDGPSPAFLPVKYSSWYYIPIAVTTGILLLILLFGTLYFVVFRSNVRYVVQKYYSQAQGKDGSLKRITTTTTTTVERKPRPLSAPNGHLNTAPLMHNKPNGVCPVVLLDENYDGWLIPMSEFDPEHSISGEFV